MGKRTAYKKAFTLAEVLITLAIIGVVAALSIPTVIKNYQKTQYATAMKKAYSNLRRVHDQILFENGGYDPVYDTSLSASAMGKYCDDNWAPKLKILKKCKTRIDCGYKTNTYRQLNKYHTVTESFPGAYDCYYLLADGTTFAMNPYGATSGGEILFSVDTNGPKAPNISGVDMFGFTLTSKQDSTIKPRASYLNCPIGAYCDPASSVTDGAGAFCAARILKCDGGEIKYNW